VGSVMLASNGKGTHQRTRHQGARVYVLSGWDSGYRASNKSGWHHSTKATDADWRMEYLYERRYSASSRGFLSTAPYPGFVEHQFGFGDALPTHHYDPSGEISACECWDEYLDCCQRCSKLKRGIPGVTLAGTKAMCYNGCMNVYAACLTL